VDDLRDKVAFLIQDAMGVWPANPGRSLISAEDAGTLAREILELIELERFYAG